MPQKVQIKKKKKTLVLTPKHVETVETEEPHGSSSKKKIKIRSTKSKLEEANQEPLGAHEHNSATLRVDDDDLKFAEDAPVLDASDSTAVELNSSTVKDPVAQIPLHPEKAEATQELPDPKEDHFKFHCYRCGQRLKVPVAWANKSIPCGRCGHDLVIPPPLVEE
jgi:hypothetical protein